MIDWLFAAQNIPLVFASLMAIAVLVYAILDGFDLGVGILLPMDNPQQRDIAIASIGPFWDANETWLVLAVGLLLVAFPVAHSAILQALYLPATLLLVGLIMRGVAFDFRAKVAVTEKHRWDWLFKLGSIISTMTQGFMLGMFIMGFDYNLASIAFAMLSSLGVTAAYALIGASWLIMKTDQKLQLRAILWAKQAGLISLVGIVTVCIINPLINPEVLERWLTVPYAYVMGLVPLLCGSMFVLGYQVLKRLPLKDQQGDWLPFLITATIFVCCFSGLSLSFYPYIVPGQLTIYETASAIASLRIILVGCLFVMPLIAGYTVFAYRTFSGKAKALSYY